MAEKGKAGIGDFLRLGANAFASGLLVAIALAMVTLLLATGAQAATGPQPTLERGAHAAG
jgi:hypothetical protein